MWSRSRSHPFTKGGMEMITNRPRHEFTMSEERMFSTYYKLCELNLESATYVADFSLGNVADATNPVHPRDYPKEGLL
jgi:hypothetical protein